MSTTDTPLKQNSRVALSVTSPQRNLEDWDNRVNKLFFLENAEESPNGNDIRTETNSNARKSADSVLDTSRFSSCTPQHLR